jgi:recombination protein RecA
LPVLPVQAAVDSAPAVSLVQSIVTHVVKSVKGKDGEVADVKIMEDDDEGDVSEWIPSGFPNVDAVLGGGWPIGRCSENSGAEGSGKSALADMAIVEVQRMGGYAVVIEFENTRSKNRLAAIGADLKRIIFHTPDYAEEAWKLVWQVMDSIEAQAKIAEKKKQRVPPVLFVWDSIGGTPVKEEVMPKPAAKLVDDKADKPGMFAKMMSKETKRLYKRIRNCRAHFMFINQERDKFGGMSFVKQTDTPGGRALKFAYTVRAQLRNWAIPKMKYPKMGFFCIIRTIKNKITAPYQRAAFVIDFKLGPSPAATAFELLKNVRVIKTSTLGAGAFTCPWKKTFTRDGWVSAFSDPAFAQRAWAEVLKYGAKTLSASGGADGEADGEEAG